MSNPVGGQKNILLLDITEQLVKYFDMGLTHTLVEGEVYYDRQREYMLAFRWTRFDDGIILRYNPHAEKRAYQQWALDLDIRRDWEPYFNFTGYFSDNARKAVEIIDDVLTHHREY